MKSILLMVSIVVVFIGLGYAISGVMDESYFFVIMAISIVFSLGYTLFSYYNAHKLAIASAKARPADRDSERVFFEVMEKVKRESRLPMPKLYVMPGEQINAFASGRDPKHSVICVTTGALKKLDRGELEGVIAHEMSHIANFDIRFMTLTTIMVGLIAIFSQMFLRSLWFGGGRDRDGRSGLILMILAVVLAILAPILVSLISLAISRKREYMADARGAHFAGNSKGLASALRKIKHDHVSSKEKRRYAKAMAPLYISDPFKKKIGGLFMTHPDVDDRINRLEKLAL